MCAQKSLYRQNVLNAQKFKYEKNVTDHGTFDSIKTGFNVFIFKNKCENENKRFDSMFSKFKYVDKHFLKTAFENENKQNMFIKNIFVLTEITKLEKQAPL